jgi:ATP-dependent Clp protease ATP-binding subunit ClpB
MRREIQEVLRTEFLPEFLNRIDDTIIFHPLGKKELTKIVDIQLKRLERQLAEAGLTLRVTAEARTELANEGFDATYGARPLKRIIQQRLANPLATALLEQEIEENSEVEIGWNGRDFDFTPSQTTPR